VTFSIVGIDPANGDLGVAVASKFPCAGAVVPWAKAGLGAVATQAWANTSFGPDGLRLMGQGLDAAAALDAVVAADEGADDRQAGMVDARGGVATFTGTACIDWAGGRSGSTFVAQGNILAGEEVIAAMTTAFDAATGDLSDRLLAALLAGDGAGGDRRGRQSAALLVVRSEGGYEGRNDRYIDLRVDDHPAASAELARLFGVWDDTMLVRHDPVLPVTAELAAEIQRLLPSVGAYRLDENGTFDEATRQALADWAGWQNLEGRLRDDDQISERLVAELRRAAGAGG